MLACYTSTFSKTLLTTLEKNNKKKHDRFASQVMLLTNRKDYKSATWEIGKNDTEFVAIPDGNKLVYKSSCI